MLSSYYFALAGGLLIGIAATILLYFNGRIAGVSGILWAAVTQNKNALWQISFVLGLPLGAFLYHQLTGNAIPAANTNMAAAVVGGLLVGYGVKLGSGCTSGHGVCGIGRLSIRSIIATITFMVTGIITVFIIRHVL